MTGTAELSSSAFEHQLHTDFRVTPLHDEASVELQLQLVEHRRGSDSPRIEQFAVVFEGPGNQLLAQGTYRFEHDELGSFELFIVPIGRRGESLRYEAVFGRLLDVPPRPPSVAAKEI